MSAHRSPPSIYVTTPNKSTFPFNEYTTSASSSNSKPMSPSSTAAALAASWRTNASELRDVTRDFSAARATSTDAKTKSYTEKEVARFEAMARNAELMASMAMDAAKNKNKNKASKTRDGEKKKKEKKEYQELKVRLV